MTRTDAGRRFVPPAHSTLTPQKVSYLQVPPDWLSGPLADLNIAKAYVAEGSADGRAGNYCIESVAGESYFVKVKRRERAAREHFAALLSAELEGSGIAALRLLREPVVLPSGEVAFVYPWLKHNFFRSNEASLAALGGELSGMHKVMESFPVNCNLSVTSLFKKNISCLRKTKYFEEANSVFVQMANLSVGYRRQLAHNDLHMGNVLFNDNDVIAIVDFEDAVGVASYPLVDISAVIERFALISGDPERAIQVLLAAYFKGGGKTLSLSAEHLIAFGLVRCYNALGILALSASSADSRWHKEWAKIHSLVLLWKNSQDVIYKALKEFR